MVKAPDGTKRQRGFALLVVLWTLGLLGLLVAGLAASARSGTGLSSNVRGSALAEAAADGGVGQAIFQLLRGGWQPDGLPHRFTIGSAAVVVTIEDQTGRFNPNFSSPPMLAALLGAAGLDPAQATDLSRMLVDWRTAATISLTGRLKLDRYRLANLPYGPPDRPFESVEEMGLVPGMSSDLLGRLKPVLVGVSGWRCEQRGRCVDGPEYCRGRRHDWSPIGVDWLYESRQAGIDPRYCRDCRRHTVHPPCGGANSSAAKSWRTRLAASDLELMANIRAH